MFSRLLLVIAALVAVVLCNPFPTVELDVVSFASNCTEYCSTAAGCVCTVRPSDCTATYLVQPDDTCTTIADHFNNFTVSQFYRWNPDVGVTCFGLQAYVPVCINTPWYHFEPPVQPAEGTIEGPDDDPVPQMPNIVSTCTKFELLAPNTEIATLAKQNGITVDEFSEWNGNVTSVWADYWVCVDA